MASEGRPATADDLARWRAVLPKRPAFPADPGRRGYTITPDVVEWINAAREAMPALCDSLEAAWAERDGLRRALRACGTGKPTYKPAIEQNLCWCFGVAALPCIDQPQCLAARAALQREGGS